MGGVLKVYGLWLCLANTLYAELGITLLTVSHRPSL